MKAKLTSLLFIVCVLIFVDFSYADEGSFSLCNTRAYDIRYDELTGKIFIMCYEDLTSTPLISLDPLTLVVDKTFNPTGNIGAFTTIDNGNKILICMGEVDGDPSTKDGALLLFDYDSGNIMQSLQHNQRMMEMIVDSSENYAFIHTVGDKYANNPNKILKVCLSTFQIVEEVVFGEFVRSIKLSSDNSKLYVQTLNVFPGLSPRLSQHGVAVFNTSDLTLLERIVTDNPAGFLALSDDGSELFISSFFSPSDVGGSGLYIVDTSTDEISEVLMFEHEGEMVSLRTMALDSESNNLYAHARISTSANLILVLDLDDYTYNFFTMGDNIIRRIVLAQTANGPRLFAIEEGTPVVHYKDVKCLFNQDPICILQVVTPMPYQGSLPAAITFDASNSYDPDGHEITYHWDFNGDGIFDGVGDEYTGDPWNPTHQFMSYGIHVVMLKVMDECGGECYAVVEVTIHPEHP